MTDQELPLPAVPADVGPGFILVPARALADWRLDALHFRAYMALFALTSASPLGSFAGDGHGLAGAIQGTIPLQVAAALEDLIAWGYVARSGRALTLPDFPPGVGALSKP